MTQRQRSKGVGLIVAATDFQFAHRQQVVELEGQIFLAVLFAQAEAVSVGLVQTEGPARHAFTDQRAGQRVLTIDHHLPRATEDPVLGQVISRQAGVAVHVVFADVQHGRYFSAELIGGFQLEARQLHYIQLHVIAEQIQRRRAEIAAHSNTLARCRSHLAHQRGDRAFRVRSADGHDGRLGVAGKQLDIAGQLHAAHGRLLQGRGRQRQARADIQLVGAAQEFNVQLTTAHFDLRVVTAQGREFWRMLPRIGDSKRHTPVRQEANQGHAALAEADNDAEVVRSDQ